MSSPAVHAVRVPQVDVNDLEMVLVEWRVEHTGTTSGGEVLCVLETAKATHDLEVDVAGCVWLVAEAGATVQVGEVIAWIGASREAVEAHVASLASGPTAGALPARGEDGPRATPRARELAAEHGIDLAAVPHKGSLVKERDVQDFLASRGAAPARRVEAAAPEGLPAQVAERVEDAGELPRHKAVIARHLAATQAEVVLATVEVEARVDAALRFLEGHEGGASLFHLVLAATARTLRDFPLLRSFRRGKHLWRWREIGLAFTLVDPERDHRLVTPVVHGADGLSLEELAGECMALSLEAYRGELAAEQLMGGCFTISMLTGLEVTRFTALQNQFQSAVLAVGSPQERVVREADGSFGVASFVTLTLSYDHGVCEGFYGGQFLTRLKAALESPESAAP